VTNFEGRLPFCIFKLLNHSVVFEYIEQLYKILLSTFYQNDHTIKE